ncbi:type II secretion system protein GspD [Thermodesulfobacteriota bacterium]
MNNPRAIRRLCAACLAGLLFFVAQAPPASLGADARGFDNLDVRPIGKFVYGLGPGADIMEAITLLCKGRGVNVVFGEDVKGEVRVILKDVSFEDALQAICESSGLTYSWVGNVIVVEGKGTRSRVFRLNYAKAKDAQSLVKQALSSTGKIASNDKMKTLLVEDTPYHIARAAEVVEQIDIKPRQVLIEAKIIEVSLRDNWNLGIDWNYLAVGTELQNLLDDVTAAGTMQTAGFARQLTAGLDGFFFTFSNDKLSMMLDALETKTDAKTLAAPRIMVLNDEEAEIIVGDRFGYPVTTTTETATLESVEFLDTGVKLTIKPRISDVGFVILEVHPEVSTGEVVGGLPSKKTAEATTHLLVRDGQTALIGGLMKSERNVINTQVPFLGSIPILGYLFKKKEQRVFRDEIIVLLTPTIVGEPDLSMTGEEIDYIYSRGDKEIQQEVKPHLNDQEGAAPVLPEGGKVENE